MNDNNVNRSIYKIYSLFSGTGERQLETVNSLAGEVCRFFCLPIFSELVRGTVLLLNWKAVPYYQLYHFTDLQLGYQMMDDGGESFM